MRVARGPLGIPLPSMPVLRPCVESVSEPERFLSIADMDIWVLLESPQGTQSLSRVGAFTCAILPSCSSIVTLSFAWIKGSVAFPRGFPTRLSHRAVPRATVVCVDPRLESRNSAGKTGFPEWTETSGGLWECGSTLEFRSPILWRTPPLEMRRERQEFFPDHAGNGSHLSS